MGYRTLTAKPISNENFKEIIQRPDFKRHEFVGHNFRMPEVCTAMGLAQLDKMEILLEKRVAIAELYEKAIQGCDWLIPQKTPEELVHSYWTYAMKLDVKQKSITWLDFRESFRYNGGGRFYGAWSLSYLEPALDGMTFPDHEIHYSKGLCPIAEALQPYLIQLKTNFESLDDAKKQAIALKKTIEHVDKL